ncbi:1-phosphofructokinase family hexose kinase [Yoonia sp.]|uniref:1-phosphofructokinase family hexose kinase n=1 Tax=Yoonia sp. TaxID=2212373 RepID=UPI00358E28F3
MHDQTPILTVTLNPAVDVATTVPRVIAGPKLRCAPPRFDPGGGGVNVARAINKLGGAATALVAVGGAMGERLLALLAAEQITALPVPVLGETRQSFAVLDETTGEQYRFNVPGPPLGAQDADTLIDAIARETPQGGYLVLSGSVSPGLAVDFPSQIIAATKHKAPKVIIDTSSASLMQLIAQPTAPAHILRVDQKEAAEAAAHPMNTIADSVAFAADLVARGVAEIVVTGRGAEGSVLVSKDQRLVCHPPTVPVRSKIGAGDAYVGSMTLALARGLPLPQALQWGVAAASATVSTDGTALCDTDTASLRFAQCETEDL